MIYSFSISVWIPPRKVLFYPIVEYNAKALDNVYIA